MPTNLLPGLRGRACQIDIPVQMLALLITLVGPRWARAYPNAGTGRPRADFVDRLFATLVYLRESTTFRRVGARVHLSASTVQRAFHPMVEMIADLGICQADATMLTGDDLASWCAESVLKMWVGVDGGGRLW